MKRKKPKYSREQKGLNEFTGDQFNDKFEDEDEFEDEDDDFESKV